MTGRLAKLPTRELPGGLTLYEAAGFGSRLRGLAGLEALPPHAGLHLPRTRSVHTFGMRFALDVLWLDRRGEVVKVSHAVPRRRHRSCRRAASCVEVAAGNADRFAAALQKVAATSA